MGAIRRSIRDTMEARAHGMRASGLEDHFADLMQEAGASTMRPAWRRCTGPNRCTCIRPVTPAGISRVGLRTGVPRRAALAENRGQSQPFRRSERVDRTIRPQRRRDRGHGHARAGAQIDLALLDDPALMALPWEGNPAISGIDFPHDDGVAAIRHVWRYAGETADRMLQDNPNPAGGRLGSDPGASEWVYRQAVSRLLRQLRLPYRFDMEFRSNLEQGTTAVAFTTAGPP